MRNIWVLAVGLVAALLPMSVSAEDLSTEKMIQMLRPPAGARSLGTTRGIGVEGDTAVNKTSPTVNLYVNFDYKSADLGQDARITLDRLVAALKDHRLIEWDFLIGGHTDAVGSDRYNLQLSDRRAVAVRNYLVSHGIADQRLVEKGFGETRLLDTQNPTDGVNRRVQITTLAVTPQ